VAAVILKPTLIGGLSVTRRWARRARAVGASVVISSAYESGVGTRILVALAAACSDVPVGLSTYTQLEDDVLRPRLALEGPTVAPEQVYEGSVQFSRLRPVEPS
jgi:O-succinylbenzoate synthase